MNFTDYKNYIQSIMALPATVQNPLMEATASDVQEEIRRISDVSGTSYVILGHLKLLQARSSATAECTELIVEGTKNCTKALLLLNQSEREERLFCLTTRGTLYYMLETEISLFERVDYHELAVKDFQTVINDAREQGFTIYIPGATINLVNSIVNITELAPPADAVTMLEEANTYLTILHPEDVEASSQEASLEITTNKLNASLGLYTGSDIGLSRFETALDGLEKLIGIPEVAQNNILVLELYLDLINYCLIWNMIHGSTNHLLTRARHNLYLAKIKSASLDNAFMKIRIAIYEREYLWLTVPSVKNALSLSLIDLDLIRDTIGPLDRPILFTRALLVTAWQQFSLRKEDARKTARMALLTLWPAYSDNQAIPYPEGTLPYSVIQNAILLMKTPDLMTSG